MSDLRPFLIAVCAAATACGQNAAPPSAGTTSAAALWRAYRTAPETQPNIPNCSTANFLSLRDNFLSSLE